MCHRTTSGHDGGRRTLTIGMAWAVLLCPEPELNPDPNPKGSNLLPTHETHGQKGLGRGTVSRCLYGERERVTHRDGRWPAAGAAHCRAAVGGCWNAWTQGRRRAPMHLRAVSREAQAQPQNVQGIRSASDAGGRPSRLPPTLLLLEASAPGHM